MKYKDLLNTRNAELNRIDILSNNPIRTQKYRSIEFAIFQSIFLLNLAIGTYQNQDKNLYHEQKDSQIFVIGLIIEVFFQVSVYLIVLYKAYQNHDAKDWENESQKIVENEEKYNKNYEKYLKYS